MYFGQGRGQGQGLIKHMSFLQILFSSILLKHRFKKNVLNFTSYLFFYNNIAQKSYIRLSRDASIKE